MDYVSKSAAHPLRHSNWIPRDDEQGVDFEKFYAVMHKKLVIAQKKNVFQSAGSLIKQTDPRR
jgi:hypothetical protein